MRLFAIWTILFLWVIPAFPAVTAALAYETVEVENGGAIKGTVTLRGDLPGPRVFPLVLYAFGTFCKKISDGKGHVLLREFNTDPAGGLQDAVISIENIDRGKPFRHIKNQYITTNCMFHPASVPEFEQFEIHKGQLRHIHPLVSVIENHQPLYVVNRDPITHNGQVYEMERGNRVLNFNIPVSNKMHGGRVNMGEGLHVMQMICGMHEYMQAWAWIVDNPYYAKTHKGGEYVIEGIPPGTYRVSAWHPHLKPIVREVTVPPNGTIDLDFEFESEKVARPLYETQTTFRITPDSQPDKNLKGCKGAFCVTNE